MKLHQITEQIRLLSQNVDEDGEIKGDIEAQLDRLTCAIADKVDGLCSWHAEAEAESAMFAAEGDRMRQRKAAADRLADRLKKYMIGCLVAGNMKEVHGRLFKVRVQRNSQPNIRLLPGEVVPEGLGKTVVEFDAKAAHDRWREWAEAVQCMKQCEASALVLVGEASRFVMQAADSHRQKAHALALPPSVKVEQGVHLRIN